MQYQISISCFTKTKISWQTTRNVFSLIKFYLIKVIFLLYLHIVILFSDKSFISILWPYKFPCLQILPLQTENSCFTSSCFTIRKITYHTRVKDFLLSRTENNCLSKKLFIQTDFLVKQLRVFLPHNCHSFSVIAK